jgi:hypothetical protein
MRYHTFQGVLTLRPDRMAFFSRFPTRRRQNDTVALIVIGVLLSPLIVLAAISFTEYTIDEQASVSWRELGAADFDGDDDIDIAGGDSTGDDLLLYTNDGSQSFTQTDIDTDTPGLKQGVVVDLDNDGDPDIVTNQIDSSPDGVFWYDNDGSASFTKRTIASTANPHFIDAEDVNDDNEVDVVAVYWSAGDIIYYEGDGADPPVWSATTLDDNLSAPDSVDIGDVDGDGDEDVVALHNSTSIQWYENDGSESFTETTIGGLGTASHNYIQMVDLDGDDDEDILVAAFGGGTIFMENDGIDPPTFTKSTIDTNYASFLHAADVDGDDDIDVLIADSDGSGTLYALENDGAADPSFTATALKSGVSYWWFVNTADIDGDGNTDILAGSNDGLFWFEYTGDVPTAATSNSGGGGAARVRFRALMKRMRSGIYTYEDQESPSLSAVGIFDPEEQARVHAAAASGSTVEDAEDADESEESSASAKATADKEESDEQSLDEGPENMLVRSRHGKAEFDRVSRIHNRFWKKKKVALINNPLPDTLVTTGSDGPIYTSSQHERICSRVDRRFSGNQTMIKRINVRLKKRFGWTCGELL